MDNYGYNKKVNIYHLCCGLFFGSVEQYKNKRKHFVDFFNRNKYYLWIMYWMVVNGSKKKQTLSAIMIIQQVAQAMVIQRVVHGNERDAFFYILKPKNGEVCLVSTRIK